MAASKKTGGHCEMLESMYSVIALLFILVACVELCDTATAVDFYRLIQYDMSGSPFGSRFAALNHHATSLHFPPGADLSRTVLIIPLRRLNFSVVREVFSSENGGNKEIHEKRENEKRIGRARTYPVYFAFENNEIDNVLADIMQNDAVGQPATATTGGSVVSFLFKIVQILVASCTMQSFLIPKKFMSHDQRSLLSHEGFSLHFYIEYKLVIPTPEPKKVASPTITNIQGWLSGLKADGDANQLPTFAIVESYDTCGAAPALSVGSDSNGSGIVALLEIARLFSLLNSNPKTSGRYNLLFGRTSGRPYNYNGTQKWLRSFDQRESIDYAICLNSIRSWDDELWIHVSKPPENAYIKQFFEGFSNVAEELDLKVGLKHKKINISNPRSVYVLCLRLVVESLNFFCRQFVNETAIIRGVKLVAESLVELANHADEENVQHEILEGIFTFYDSTSARLNIYQVMTGLNVLSQGLDDLINLFQWPPSRKMKSA
ncbi:hypothetical protein CRYUN_Cryun03dG0138400 [Craigia yunnanensis]